jgi:hypothetical protein
MPEVLATRVEPQEPAKPDNSAPAGKVTEVTPEAVEKPLEALEKPYLNDLLSLGEAYNHFKMKDLVAETDEAIKEELAYKEVKLSREAYKELIDTYLKKLDLPEGISLYTQVEKLHQLVSINRKLLQATKEKQEFMAMNPADMSSTQLKRYISTTL